MGPLAGVFALLEVESYPVGEFVSQEELKVPQNPTIFVVAASSQAFKSILSISTASADSISMSCGEYQL